MSSTRVLGLGKVSSGPRIQISWVLTSLFVLFCSMTSAVTSVYVQTGILQDVTQNNMQIGWQILRLNTKATKADISLMKQSIYNNNMKLQCHKATIL